MSGVAIGSAAVVVGAGANIYAADQASKSADAATASAAQSATNQLEFDKAQYADWESVYGGVEDNLSSYYNDLTSDSYEALNLQSIQASYQAGIKNLDTNLAQRGLDSSGLEAQGLIQLESDKATDSAYVTATGDQYVADQQLNFLNVGLGNKSSLQSSISNDYGNQTQLYTNQASQYNAQANSSYNAAGQSISSGVSGMISASALNYKQPTYYTADNGYYGPFLQ